MNILHVIEGKANPNRANGVNQVIYGLAKYQSRAGHSVRIFGMSSGLGDFHEKVDWEGFSVDVYKGLNNRTWPYLKRMISEADVIHLHSVWKKYNVEIGRYLEKINKPYVITAHCGLTEDRIKQSNYLIKTLFHALFQRRLYERASVVHALTREESTGLFKYCDNRIEVINNGVDFDTYGRYVYRIKNRDKIVLGYLGRLSTEKNVDNLVRALNYIPRELRERVELRLIGPIGKGMHNIESFIREQGVQDNVKLLGGKYGEDKIKELLDLDIYIHPAYSDVVGISVMEALALGIPSVVTRTSHMSYFAKSNGFVMVEPTSFDLARGIEEIASNKANWANMSKEARTLAENTFNWEKVVGKILKMYETVIK